MIEKIFYHRNFKKHYQELPKKIKILAEEREGVFRKNPQDPRLKIHKLSGRLKNIWSFSVDKNYRILFIYHKNREIIFLDIGTHEIYK